MIGALVAGLDEAVALFEQHRGAGGDDRRGVAGLAVGRHQVGLAAAGRLDLRRPAGAVAAGGPHRDDVVAAAQQRGDLGVPAVVDPGADDHVLRVDLVVQPAEHDRGLGLGRVGDPGIGVHPWGERRVLVGDRRRGGVGVKKGRPQKIAGRHAVDHFHFGGEPRQAVDDPGRRGGVGRGLGFARAEAECDAFVGLTFELGGVFAGVTLDVGKGDALAVGHGRAQPAGGVEVADAFADVAA